MAWSRPETSALHHLATDAEPREVVAAGRALWLDGNKLLYSDADGITLEDAGSPTRTWPLDQVGSVGKLPGADWFWACSIDHGILRLDGEGVTPLTPDFLIPDSPYVSGCWGIDASPSGSIAYPTALHRIGVVEATTGSRRAIDQPFHPFGRDEADLYRADAVRLSPDGTLVLHEKRWEELQGDAIAQVGEGELSIFDMNANQPYRVPGVLGDGWLFLGGSPGWVWYGPWIGTTAPGVFVPGLDLLPADARLVGLGDPIILQGIAPRASRGNHLFLETWKGAGLLELATGTLHHLMDAPSIEGFEPFRWGGPVAIMHSTDKCIRWPHDPSSCHTQVWGLSLWREEIGVSHVAYANQPIQVHAIGPDGSMVVGGRFLPQVPEVAEPREIHHRFILLDGGGRFIRELREGRAIENGIGGEHFGLLLYEGSDDERNRFKELVAIDWKTGEETVLVSGRFISSLNLDHSDRRVSAIVTRESGAPEEIWSGVVGR